MQKQLPQPWAPKWQRFLVAFFAAGLIYQLGHLLFGVRIELFWGVAGYDLAWVATMFILPVVTGIVVGFIYGWGGKLVAHFPPLIILGIDYYSMMHGTVPEGAKLIPLMWWGFFVILNMEFCAAGGVIGELLLKKYYGTWDLPGTSDYAPADSEIIPRDDGK